MQVAPLVSTLVEGDAQASSDASTQRGQMTKGRNGNPFTAIQHCCNTASVTSLVKKRENLFS